MLIYREVIVLVVRCRLLLESISDMTFKGVGNQRLLMKGHQTKNGL